MQTPRLSTLLTAAILAAAALPTAIAEDGELFPNVKAYDQEVPAPVSKPEKALEIPRRAPAPVPAPAPEPATPAEAPPPKQPTVRLAPYRDSLLAPLLSETSASRFEKDFAERLKGHLKLNAASKARAADDLWKEAEAPAVAPDLKRVLWLHAMGLSIKGDSKLDSRAQKARAVLPLLTEETLPAAQARADAVTELAFGALATASDDLLAMVMESQCKLARMQIQGGFPDEAAASLKVAREAYRYLKTKTDAQRDTVAETAAWVDRAAAARNLSAKWTETLAAKPNDNFVNTQLATLNLSLYGDVRKAARFAAKSERKEFQAFAAAVKDAFPADSQETAPAKSLALAASLLDLAESALAIPFDRYAVAALAENMLNDTAPLLEPADAQRAQAQKARAASLILKSGLRRPAFATLASLAAETSSTATTSPRKLVLFVKESDALVKYVKPTPAQNAEALVLIREEVKRISDKLNIKFVEIETEHCLVLTDWEPAEHGFLKKNVEGAYAAVARQFDFPLSDNIFPGKFPVFMFLRREDFQDILQENMKRSAGVFHTTPEGVGYVAMFKPEQYRYGNDALNKWGRSLTWCMSYGFLARYRTNKQVPLWISQGFAANVGFGQFPDNAFRNASRGFANARMESFENFLKNAGTDFHSQSLCASFIEFLIAKDKKAFVQFMNKIKDGADPETALKETFNWSYADMEKPWRAWAARRYNQ